MIDWIFNLFSKEEKPKSLAEDYRQDLGPSLIRDYGICKYDNISLGWIYEGIFDQDRQAKQTAIFQGLPAYETDVEQRLGSGWSRYNLGVL